MESGEGVSASLLSASTTGATEKTDSKTAALSRGNHVRDTDMGFPLDYPEPTDEYTLAPGYGKSRGKTRRISFETRP
jgi:hypothetical protein